jgi:hypothetical protein
MADNRSTHRCLLGIFVDVHSERFWTTKSF